MTTSETTLPSTSLNTIRTGKVPSGTPSGNRTERFPFARRCSITVGISSGSARLLISASLQPPRLSASSTPFFLCSHLNLRLLKSQSRHQGALRSRALAPVASQGTPASVWSSSTPLLTYPSDDLARPDGWQSRAQRVHPRRGFAPHGNTCPLPDGRVDGAVAGTPRQPLDDAPGVIVDHNAILRAMVSSSRCPGMCAVITHLYAFGNVNRPPRAQPSPAGRRCRQHGRARSARRVVHGA